MPKPQKHDFSLQLTRVFEPKGGPGVELAILGGRCTLHGAHAALEAGLAALGLRSRAIVGSPLGGGAPSTMV